MGCGEGVRMRPPAWSMLTEPVPEPGDHPGLVLRDPVRDPISEAGNDRLDVLLERLDGVAGRPPAAVLECLREIPVIERDEGLDPAREELVDHPVVEVEAGRVHAATPVGHDPRPGDRESVRADSEVAHQLDVVAEAVVRVARDDARVAVDDRARQRGEAIPDALAAPVLGDRPLDLVGGARRSPDEPWREKPTVGVRECLHHLTGKEHTTTYSVPCGGGG